MPHALTKPNDATIAIPAAKTPGYPNIIRFAEKPQNNWFLILQLLFCD